MLTKDESRWKEAEAMYRKTFEINPNYARAYNNLGWLLFTDESRWKEAEEMWRKATEINPNYADAYYNLGILLAKDESRLAEAEEMYRKAIEINPNDAEAYNNLGWLLYRQGKVDEATTNFEISAKLDENYGNPRVSLAGIYRKQGNLKKSKVYADQAKAVIKDDDYYNLACLYSVLDNKDEAFRYLKLAVEKDSSLKSLAKTDADLDFIRDDARFAEIAGD